MFCKEANSLIHSGKKSLRKEKFCLKSANKLLSSINPEKKISVIPIIRLTTRLHLAIYRSSGDLLPFPATLRCRLCWRPMDNKRRVLLAFPSRVNRQVMIIMGVICSRNSDLYIPQGKQQGGLFFIQQKRQIKEPFFCSSLFRRNTKSEELKKCDCEL